MVSGVLSTEGVALKQEEVTTQSKAVVVYPRMPKEQRNEGEESPQSKVVVAHPCMPKEQQKLQESQVTGTRARMAWSVGHP